MNTKHLISLGIFAVFCTHAFGANSIKPFSQYGNIQNVQNYSSNPFWSPNAPYNQRMPTPVYANGVDVETHECQQIVYALVSAHCAQIDNCRNTQLSDIRPTLILQLSRMPGGNYATSCNGYIDDTFNQYVASNTVVTPTGAPVAFPTTNGVAPSSADAPTLLNPFSPKIQQWQQDILDRKQEIQDLQAATGGEYFALEHNDFPLSSADISFADKMTNSATGYQPFKDNSAYKPINIRTDDTTVAQTTGKQQVNRENMILLIAKALKDAQK